MAENDCRYTLACRLARFLRKNGDKVICGSCKLSLTTAALCLLNSLFSDVLNQDKFINTDANMFEALEDVQFLYDFIKRTSSLKLFHGMQTLRGGVDLSQFSNLTVLELRKIPAHLIIGLNSLSVQLRALICTRSIYLLKEIFGCPEEREAATDIWIELKELNVSYNYLETLDNSFKSLPNVEILDLSHNNIKNTDEIQILKRLKFVNLSYNQLDKLPVFNSLSCRSLIKLYVRNNNLEDLNGLECLFALEELDVGYNLLSEDHVLNPLGQLKSLKVLNLEGNPLFFHIQHRMLVSTFIHPNVLSKGFHLNGKLLLVPRNKFAVASDFDGLNATRSHQTAINTVVGDMQNMINAPVDSGNSTENHSISPLMLDRISCQEKSASFDMIKNKKDKTISQKAKASKTGKKYSEVPINNPVEVYSNDEVSASPDDDDSNIPSHLKTKKIMEARRKERGAAWLIPDNSFQRFVTLPPRVPSNTPVFNNPYAQNSENICSDLQTRLESHNALETISKSPLSSPVVEEMAEVLDLGDKKSVDDRARHISKESDDIEILQESKDESFIREMNESGIEDVYTTDIYSDGEPTENILEEEESDEESEDSIFFVERQNNSRREALCVNIGVRYAKEIDVISRKLLNKLDLRSLSSVHSVIEADEKRYEVHLEFDNVNTCRQKRLYILEDLESAKVLSQILQPFADAKTLKDATLGALECLKCNSQFSKQVAKLKIIKTKMPFLGKNVLSSSYDSTKDYQQEAAACPNCGSNILVEMESIPLPSIATPPRIILNTDKTNSAKMSLDNTPDSVSVGSASSGNLFANLFSSIKISPNPKRKSFASGDCQNEGVSVPNSNDSYNFEVDNASKSHGLDSQLRRNSSDITIISNPSQSSIVVIPDPELEHNLHPIIERDSISSLSPPVSRNGTICFSDKVEESQNNLHLDAGFQSNLKEKGIPRTSNSEDHDFCSATESFTDGIDKHVKGADIVSSGSEMYSSPNKSTSFMKTKCYSSELDESINFLNIGQKDVMTYDKFRELHHRLKLHIEISLFGKDESLTACLQTSIVPLSTGEEIYGLFVLSSKKVYVMKFLPMYKENLEDGNVPVEKIVQVIYSGSLNKLKQIKYILGNQGLTVACGPSSHVYTLVIRDSDICNSFISLISDLIQENVNEFGKFEFLSSSDETLKLLNESVLSPVESDAKPEILLHLFAFWNDQNEENCPVCIVLTRDALFLSKVLYTKQESCSDLLKTSIYQYSVIDHQKISDVISLKLQKKLINVEISFLNESFHTENEDTSSWTIKMETMSALRSFINALKIPWEEIFGISLPLNLSE